MPWAGAPSLLGFSTRLDQDFSAGRKTFGNAPLMVLALPCYFPSVTLEELLLAKERTP